MRFRILLSLLVSCAICAAAPARADFVHAVFSQDGTDVLAPGDGGQLMRSLDGGATWGVSTLGATALRGAAARGFTIVIVGDSGKVWRSTDAAATGRSPCSRARRTCARSRGPRPTRSWPRVQRREAVRERRRLMERAIERYR
jgi:hypothetical protein